MADVDKTLPNVEQEIKVPSPEELEISEKEEQQKIVESGEPVEVTENEDGSVDINYDPAIGSVEGGQNHYDNLAEHLPCLLYTSPSPRDGLLSRMPSSA